MLSSKINMRYSKNNGACFNKIIWLIIMKMRLKMENRSKVYDITGSGYGHKYTKYEIYLSMTLVTCNKQCLSNIWSWIHGKV